MVPSTVPFGKPTDWWNISPETQQQLKQAIARARTGEFIRYEVEVLLGSAPKTGIIDFSLRALKDENGQVLLLIAEGRDITDRVKAEQALKENQILLQSVLDAIPPESVLER